MTDVSLRHAALFAVQRLWRRFGDAVPFRAIDEGFLHEGERIPFLSVWEGVYKPARLAEGALSVRSTLGSAYEDERISDDRVWYEYSPKESRNRWLRESMARGDDLLYFLQVKPKPGVEYLIFAPVHVIEDDPAGRRFLLDLSPSALYEGTPEMADLHPLMERRYGASEVQTRLFQAHFRREVLGAYRSRCAVCRLGERPVLDGAHLVADREELGAPRVANGLALCALHHRTFDRDLIGITPELRVHAFRDRLEHAEEEEEETVSAIVRFDRQRLRLPWEETHYLGTRRSGRSGRWWRGGGGRRGWGEANTRLRRREAPVGVSLGWQRCSTDDLQRTNEWWSRCGVMRSWPRSRGSAGSFML